MADYLSAGDWKTKAKSAPDAKDTDLLLAPLQEYGKAKTDADRKTALTAILENATKVKSKNSKSKDAKVKELVEYVEEVLTLAGNAAKAVDKKLAEAEEEEKKKGAAALIDTELVKQLEQLKRISPEKPRFFVLAMGKPGGIAISKVEITRKQRAKARKWRKGKGKLIEGKCYGVGGKPIFDLGELKPPGGMAQMFKKSASNQVGKTVKLMLRGGGHDVDADEDLEELEDLGEDTDEGDELEGEDLDDQLEGDELDDGAPKDEEPEEEVEAEASVEAPVAKSEEETPATGGPEEAFKKRMAEVRPKLTKALTEANENDPERASQLDGLASQALEEAKAKRFAQALGLVEALAKVLDLPSGSAEAGLAIFKARLQASQKRLAELNTKAPTLAKPLMPMLKTSLDHDKAGRVAEGTAALDTLDGALASAERGQTAETEVTTSAGVAVVAKRAYSQARQTAQAEMAKLQALIKSDKETQADPRYKTHIVKEVDDMINSLNHFDDRLLVALDKGDDAQAKQIVKEYQTYLNDHKYLKKVDDSVYGSVKIYSTLDKTLKLLDTKLQA
jgi:hypothetical protein